MRNTCSRNVVDQFKISGVNIADKSFYVINRNDYFWFYGVY